MVLSSLLYIVSAKMWLIVKIAVKFWIPIFLQICILATLSISFFFFIFHCIIRIGKFLDKCIFVLAQSMYIMCEN